MSGKNMYGENIVHVCSHHVCIADHMDWFEAITADDPERIAGILESNSRSKQLTHGHFEYDDSVLKKQVSAGPCSSVQLPLAVAAVCGATQSIKALLHAGVSPKQLDCHGNNVVHSMIAYLHYHSDQEDAIVSTFQVLIDSVSEDVMREILHHENSFGLRPIEFAAQHGQGKMVLAIMNTPGVYMTKQQVAGLTCYKWYNITEYESTGSRRDKSPLLLITYVDKTMADTSGFSAFMDSSIIQSWLLKKILMNLPLMIFWCLMRFTFITLYMLISLDMSMANRNSTMCISSSAVILSSDVHFVMVTSMLALIATSLIFDTVDIIQLLTQKALTLRQMISRRKKLLAQVTLYRVCHWLLCMFLLVCSPLMYGYQNQFAMELASYAQIVNPVLAAWSFLYFVQLVPSLGFYVISIYNMIKDLGSLFILYVLMILPFTQAFYTFTNTNTMQGCIAGFSSVFETMYSTFLIMLNMVSLTGFNIRNVELLYVTHFLYTFSISILLINFFIAVMSDTMSSISQRRQHAESIQRLSVAFTLENHVRWFMKPFYAFMIKKLFVVELNNILVIDVTDTAT